MTESLGEAIYTHRTYVPLVGSTFAVERPDGEHVSVELVEANSLPGRGESFSLVFRGSPGIELEQRTYNLAHDALGGFPLFLVPIGPVEDGSHRFEAVVNRLEHEG